MSLTTLVLPVPPVTANERLLGNVNVEEFTGIVGNTLTLSGTAALALVFKNGLLLSQTAASTTGTTVTLSVASIAGDAWTVLYWGRTT